MSLPLNDINVLDFSNLLPGPFSSMILSDLGANIVKVERPNIGDSTRRGSRMFNAINRNKKSIAIDLKDPQNIERIKANIHKFDIVIEGFRPGVMKRLGLDYETLKRKNERLIYCSISGFGQEGSYKDVPGHDINYLALSGMLSISGDPSGPPAAWGGVQIADLSSSLYAVISILAALRNRDLHGKGDYVDVSITDATLAMMAPRIGQYYDKGQPSKEQFMGRGCYGVFQTKDDQYIALGALEDNFFQKVCDAIQREDLKDSEAYRTQDLRAKNANNLNRIIQEEIEKKECEYWLQLFEKNDIPSTRVMNIDELTNVDLFNEREVFATYGNINEGEYFVHYPVKFINIPKRQHNVAPSLGEHNDDFF